METRRLGKTGHQSTVVTFGTFAIGKLPQGEADRLIEYALSRGINQFDVAPSYADAELRLGDYLKRHPQPDLFVSCKTNQRGKTEASAELHRTLERLGRDRFDLYQLHSVGNDADLEACFAPGGSMEAILDARDQGLVTHIGITGHGHDAPATHAAALRRFDFATVMTSCNVYLDSLPAFRRAWQDLLALCRQNDVGIHVLKATARAAWNGRTPTFGTWYEPLADQTQIDRAVAWILDQPVTTLCSAGDPHLLGPICDAAERYRQTDGAAALALLADPGYGDIFVG
jgi:aryl-alcohol dehydrogenase-like predicted oxidoreductase